MDYILKTYKRAKSVLLEPTRFFNSLKRERGIDEALKYLALVSLANIFFTGAQISAKQGTEYFLTTLVSAYLFTLVGSLLAALFVQLFVILLGGKSTYDATFRALAYGYTPTALFGWIPWIGVLGVLYSLYLYSKGLSVLHSISMWRAAAIFFLPLIVVAFLALLVLTIALLATGAYIGTLGGLNLPTAGLV